MSSNESPHWEELVAEEPPGRLITQEALSDLVNRTVRISLPKWKQTPLFQCLNNVFNHIECLPLRLRKEYCRLHIRYLATRICTPDVSQSECDAACFIMPDIYAMMDMDKNIHPMSYIDYNIHVMLHIDHNIHVAFYYGHRTLMTILQLEKIARCIN